MSVKDKVAAIDRFVRTIKESGVYDDVQAACIMAGWTNLAGALTPFKGSAPTNGGFLAADLDAGIGLRGDGSGKYLNSNRANNADNYRDRHAATYCSDALSAATNDYRLGATSVNCTLYHAVVGTQFVGRDAGSIYYKAGSDKSAGLVGSSREDNTGTTFRLDGETVFEAGSNNAAGDAYPYGIFCRNSVGTFQEFGPYTLSWYSFGSSTDLAALDSAVSTLMADLRSIDEAGFDRDALAYIRAVEAADGAYLETGVKKAINRFIVGLKKDGIWDAIKASCILCGARTIAGALVPLAGTAPTSVNFASGDYNRETGLVGNGTTKYLDTNRSGADDPSTDGHLSVFATSVTPNAAMIGYYSSTPFYSYSYLFSNTTGTNYSLKTGSQAANIGTQGAGLYGVSKTGVTPGKLDARLNGTDYTATFTDVASQGLRYFVFCRNLNGAPASFTTSRLAFYSVGSSLSLSALDARVTTLVSEIAAAIP